MFVNFESTKSLKNIILKLKSYLNYNINKIFNKNKILIIFSIIIIFSFLLSKKNNHKYKIIAISYGDYKYTKQLKFNKLTAINIGKVNEYYAYKPEDIDINFKNQNEDILSRNRGNGYWLWKPYFILKTLKEKMNDDDYLIYTDSGVLYLDKAEKIVDFMISKNEDMWAIRLRYLEKHFSKRDAFILLGADFPIYTDTYQFMAGIQIYKKSRTSENFLENLLYYSTDKRIITDDPNTQGLSNYDGFIENRHDQTIFSILTKKYRISKNNTMQINDFNNNKYNLMPMIFCIFRRIEFKSFYELRNICITHKLFE